MDWSKTKTIFIVVFLILDIFLFTLFLNKYQSSQYEVIAESDLEEKINEDNIQYNILPVDVEPLSYLNAEAHVFSSADIDSLSRQTAVVENRFTLRSELDVPIKVNDFQNPAEVNSFLSQSVINGQQYTFWEYDEDNARLIYYQEYEDTPFYFNLNGRIVFQLDENMSVISYEQTMLDSVEEFAEEQSIITPMNALETFYRHALLERGSEVIAANLGYYTFIQLTESQVLSPTWRFVIEEEDGDRKSLYLNAVEGQVIDIDEDSLELKTLEEENDDAVE
ncbi:two-component system regulatory protein YycI [Jeotgalibacillus soli]|uniref:Regulatory protein YycH-like domain-containing protein n=1 Tax=Jeotgalibacillus soli TaxID=889306 RepID=A0A0C2VXS6_9BACL|nr:two-component system regulatory protein YycI [Jeotgalibacillus soli]KIL49226.1 hypothetical protein KP78_06940 [Jeotgalibacillus soli]